MHDLIVMGGGPGGYLAAERAGALGKSVLLVEQRRLGGVCLNEGCIPTKTLINAAKVYTHRKEAAQFGVVFEGARFELAAAMAWKKKTVDTLVRGVEYQMKRYKVEVVEGTAELTGRNRVRVGETVYEAKNIIVATGSSTAMLPIPGADLGHGDEGPARANGGRPRLVTSREILEIEELPARLVVIGGGVIGMEFASLFSHLGSKVEVIEMLDTIVPVMDAEISRLLQKSLNQITFHLKARVEEIGDEGVRFTDAEGKSHLIGADLVLMAVGRRANVAGIGLEAAGVDFDKTGIRVNEQMRTNLPGLYAVGDVTGKSLLAHSAYRMAEVAVNTMFGAADRMRYSAIPWVVYTIPEASGCGLTEEQAAKDGRRVRTAKLQMRANGRFIAENGQANGLCKVIVDADTERLLGVHIIGATNSEMIYGAAAMIEAELRVKELREIIFPHPSVSEIIRDTVWEL